MSEPIWKNNLRDAVLLDPLVMIHGNVKDIFYTEQSKRTRLPEERREDSYLPFDTWLALELEEKGFPIVLFYDLVDGAVALRGNMVQRFTELASPQSGTGRRSNTNAAQDETTDTPQQNEPLQPESLNLSAPPTLPTSQGSSSEPQADWMVDFQVRQSPEDFFRTLYKDVFPQRDTPVAIICRFTDRYLRYTDRQDESERRLSLLIQKTAMSVPPPTKSQALSSRILMLFDIEGSIPQELNIQAPFSRSVRIPSPSIAEREQFFRHNHSMFYSQPHDRFDPESSPDQLLDLANLSDGLEMQDLFSLMTLSNRERLGLGKEQFKSLLDRFRFGTRENAWTKIDDDTLRQAKERLTVRVKGQDEVIDEVVPTLIRAKLGLSDIRNSTQSTKPRGVFFFVGPTGVGKTELSKAIAELIFGDEKTLVRFDMSEYSEEHQQARLIGAPPGYVGFDQGGQLTNTILERPFSVILFDEIEKAHGRILDKFLQILDDGRLTDGSGRTVYFSEAIIIFTSNLGTAPAAMPRQSFAGSGVAQNLPFSEINNTAQVYEQLEELSYDDLCEHFRRSVKDFFVNRLGRPELLNRIGEDNILVFKFLKDEGVRTLIVDKQIRDVAEAVNNRFQIRLSLTPAFKILLKSHPNGFKRNGARGVRHLLSKLVVDELAEQVFMNPTEFEGRTFHVDYLVKESQIPVQPFDKKKIDYRWEKT